jgi:predicted membrane-bound spermidine synthase
MLTWTPTKYKFTLGIGSLATTAIMAELWKSVLSIWVIMIIALVPLAIFVLLDPRTIPARVVVFAQVFASLWYVITVVVLTIGIIRGPELPDDWAIIPIFCAVGLVPCVLVIRDAIRGRHGAEQREVEP